MEMNSNWQNQGKHEKLSCSPRHVTLQYLYISGIKARSCSPHLIHNQCYVIRTATRNIIMMLAQCPQFRARPVRRPKRREKSRTKNAVYLHFSKRHNIYMENIYKSNFSLSLSLVSAAALIVGAHTQRSLERRMLFVQISCDEYYRVGKLQTLLNICSFPWSELKSGDFLYSALASAGMRPTVQRKLFISVGGNVQILMAFYVSAL